LCLFKNYKEKQKATAYFFTTKHEGHEEKQKIFKKNLKHFDLKDKIFCVLIFVHPCLTFVLFVLFVVK